MKQKHRLTPLFVGLVLALTLAVGATTVAVAAPTAAKITTKTIKKVVNKAISKRAPTLSVDKVDGFDANQLVRATSATDFTGIGDFSSQTYLTKATTQVQVPVTGVLHLTGTMTVARSFNNGAGVPCNYIVRMTVDGVAATAEVIGSDYDSAGQFGVTVPVTGVASVAPGTRTVSIQIKRQPTGGNCYYWRSALTALFVPFGGDGVQGSAPPVPAPKLPSQGRPQG